MTRAWANVSSTVWTIVTCTLTNTPAIRTDTSTSDCDGGI
jgi:hypothetical protein